MCGRFALSQATEALIEQFEAQPANDLPDKPDFNICPTDQVVACVAGDGLRHLRMLRWGFIPHWYAKPAGGPLLINARMESLADKPAFRDAIRQRRCLIPADGFYEWSIGQDGARLPWWVERADGQPMTFAGFWTDWVQGDMEISCCAIVTGPAGPDLEDVHHREPILIDEQDYGLWLGEEGKGAARLMRQSAPGTMRKWRVGTEVNSNRATGEQLREPLTGTPEHGLPPQAAKAPRARADNSVLTDAAQRPTTRLC